MEDPTKQLLKSAQEGAEGSGSSVGAQLVAKLSEGNADPKLVTEEIKQRMVRGGRGSKGEPSEIKDSIVKAQEDAVRIDNTLSKLKNEKEGLLRTIADFRIKEKQLVETGRKEEVEAIRKAIANAQNEVDKINGVVPESVALDDHKKIQSIVSEWYAEKQKAKEAAEKIRQAESKLETTPDDGRALGDAIRGKTEKAEAEEQLAEAEREAELILKNKTPNPVRDEGVHHTNDETVEERNFLNHRRSERVAPGVFGLKKENEEMQKEMDKNATDTSEAPVQQQSEPATIGGTGIEEKNMKQELPPLEFTLEPTEDEKNLARVEERVKEVAARQAELEAEPKGPFQKSAVGEEIGELAKEMSSLDERRKEIEAKKPLQSAYDMAMDRIWKENEAKRNALLGKTPESDIEHDVETHNAILPVATEEKEETVGTPREEQEAAFEKFENIAEEKNVSKERALSMIASMRENVEAEAERKKTPEGAVRRVGEVWNKVPTRYKLLLAAGMFASGFGAAAAGATAAVGTLATIGAGLRAVGGAGLFVAIENGLKNRAEKKGGKRSGFGEFRDTTLAAALSIVIVGVLPNMARDYAVEHGFFQKISEFFNFGDKSVEAPIETATYVETAKAGDSIWKMAEHQLEAHYGEKFTSLSPEKQTYLIDAVKDKITLGMREEAANTLAVGQSMDFKQVFTDKDFMNGMFTNAQNLTPEQIANIKNYDASLSIETPARTVSANEFLGEEFLNEQLHTTFTPEEAGTIITPQVIPTPEQVVASPVEPKDVLMEGVTHEASEQYVPTSFIQPEILPGNTAELAYVMASADAIINTDMDILFGESKFLGFGHTNGVDSINWKDPQVGFGGKTVTEIMSSTPSAVPAEGGRTFGVENFEATNKMKEYLSSVTSMTGVNPNSNEKVVDFIRRASVAKLSK